jgi:hypothetical protein
VQSLSAPKLIETCQETTPTHGMHGQKQKYSGMKEISQNVL